MYSVHNLIISNQKRFFRWNFRKRESREFFVLLNFELFFRFTLNREKISAYFPMETTLFVDRPFACASKDCAIRFLIADRWLTAEIVNDAVDENIVARNESFILSFQKRFFYQKKIWYRSGQTGCFYVLNFKINLSLPAKKGRSTCQLRI